MFTLGALLLCLAVGVQCNFNGGYGQGGYYQRPPPQQHYQRPYFPQNRPYPGPGPSCPPHFCPSHHCPNKTCPSGQFCHRACASVPECEETSCAECELCPSCEENEPVSCEECECTSTSCEEIVCSTCETCISPTECPSDADVSCSECPSDVDGSCPECSCPEEDACPSSSDCEASVAECPSVEVEPFCSQEALEYDAIYEACVLFLDGTGPPCREQFHFCPFSFLNPNALLNAKDVIKSTSLSHKSTVKASKGTITAATKKNVQKKATTTKDSGIKSVLNKVLGSQTKAQRSKRSAVSSVDGICDEIATLIVDLVATIEGHGLCCDLTGLALHATDATPSTLTKFVTKKNTASKTTTKAAKKSTTKAATPPNQKTATKAKTTKTETPAKKAKTTEKATPAKKAKTTEKATPAKKAKTTEKATTQDKTTAAKKTSVQKKKN